LMPLHDARQVMERRAAAEAGVEESASDASGPRDAHPHARARSSGGRCLVAAHGSRAPLERRV